MGNECSLTVAARTRQWTWIATYGDKTYRRRARTCDLHLPLFNSEIPVRKETKADMKRKKERKNSMRNTSEEEIAGEETDRREIGETDTNKRNDEGERQTEKMMERNAGRAVQGRENRFQEGWSLRRRESSKETFSTGVYGSK